MCNRPLMHITAAAQQGMLGYLPICGQCYCGASRGATLDRSCLFTVCLRQETANNCTLNRGASQSGVPTLLQADPGNSCGNVEDLSEDLLSLTRIS